jgi:hypothetical protein
MSHHLEDLTSDDIVLDTIPDEVVASLEIRDRWMASLRDIRCRQYCTRLQEGRRKRQTAPSLTAINIL